VLLPQGLGIAETADELRSIDAQVECGRVTVQNRLQPR